MSRTALVWVFKILGTLTLSILLWAVFIGRGGTVATLTAVDSTGAGTGNGPLYEQGMFGTDDAGFKAYLQEEWCNNSNNNGYMLADFVEDSWRGVRTSSSTSYVFKLD